MPLNSYKSEGTSGEAQGIRECGLSYTLSGHEWNRIVFFILHRPIFRLFFENSAIGIRIREGRGARQNLESSPEEQQASKIEVRLS